MANLYAYVGSEPISLVDPDGENALLAIAGGAALGAGIDVGAQLWGNGGNINCIDWGSVGLSAALGAGFTGSGILAEIFLRAWASQAARRALIAGIPTGPRSLLGQSFGKLGTVVKSPGLGITGFAKHGINQAISRGVSPRALLNTVKNPAVVLRQSGGQFLHLSNQAAVVLSPAGKVITTYPSSMFGADVTRILNAIPK